MHDVCLHSTSEGLPEVARFHTGDAEPELERSPAGQLCIAQSSWQSADLSLQCSVDLPVQESSSAKSSALIWDPELAAVVHHLGPEVSAVLHKPEPCYQTEGAMWATSCRYLLAQGSPHPLNKDYNEDYHPYEVEVSGWLVIADVVQNKVVAKSRVKSTEGRDIDYLFAILLVPYAQAVILQPYTQVKDLPSLTQAGFSVGNLPKGTEIGGGFSPDAEFLAVQSSRSAREDVQLFSCSIVGPHVCLTLVRGGSSATASLAQFPPLAGCQHPPFYACSIHHSMHAA